MRVRKAVFAVPFVLALFLRFAFIAATPETPLPPDTETEYDPMAVNFLSGKGFISGDGKPDHTRGPGFALFLAGSYALFGRNFPAVRIEQAVLDCVTVLLAMLFAQMTFCCLRRTLLAGFLIAANPLLVYASGLVGPETLFVLFFTLSLVVFLAGMKTGRAGLFLCAGVLLGWTCLIRSTPLLLPAVLSVWLVARCRFSRRALAHAALLCLGCLAGIAPWTARNWVVFREFIPTCANSGSNFLRGSSLAYLGPRGEVEARMTLPPASVVPRLGESPKAVDSYLWRIGLYNYRTLYQENGVPGILKLFAVKAARFWFATDSGTREKQTGLMLVCLLLLAGAGVARTARIRPVPDGVWTALLCIGYFWAAHTALFPLARYTLPLLPLLCVLASGIVPRQENGVSPSSAG